MGMEKCPISCGQENSLIWWGCPSNIREWAWSRPLMPGQGVQAADGAGDTGWGMQSQLGRR